ncbi:branched-chain amino acid ABC transporter permease [Roseobacter sp. N2S]|uniref:branched-chain amino acid ABC transporter permease n=1 Tax=Roseobacter sp. N2S TaxID=2663844 RepID=UPI002856753B|nr:branched-chain amino acid ABC transporter permease [Roseobacter sp. N2S]MDR6265736.1 branched-chain amino acid transport system permease protein [Roseobacter sp. N2S]
MQSPWQKELITTLLIGLAAVYLLPFAINTFTLSILLIYGLLGLSLGLIWGFGGILCFGQAAFFGLGAYTYAIAAVNIGESTLPMILSILVPALFAALLGAMMFYGRLADVYLGVITLVVTLILFKFINSTAGPEYVIGTARLGGFNGIPGFQTLNIPGRPDDYIWGDSFYYVCFGAVLGVYLLVTWLLRSSFGRIAIGIRENDQRMSLMGYDTRARKTVLFAIGAAIAGLAGGLYANWAEIVTPGLFSLGQSAEIIIWCIVGGLGTRLGPILGAAGLAYLKFLLGQQSVVDNTMITGLILVLFVLFLPKGIVPAVVNLWAASFGRRVKRGGRRAGRATRAATRNAARQEKAVSHG